MRQEVSLRLKAVEQEDNTCLSLPNIELLHWLTGSVEIELRSFATFPALLIVNGLSTVPSWWIQTDL